jgi:hypothetical protein
MGAAESVLGPLILKCTSRAKICGHGRDRRLRRRLIRSLGGLAIAKPCFEYERQSSDSVQVEEGLQY